MLSQPRPHADDVIVAGNSTGSFVVSDSEGTVLIAWATIEELLDSVARYVDRHHAGAWCICDDRTLAPLMNPVLLRRMWSEFVEMPGLRLTRPQAQRLWGVDAATCLSALETLVALKALVRAPDATYARPSTIRSTHFLQAS